MRDVIEGTFRAYADNGGRLAFAAGFDIAGEALLVPADRIDYLDDGYDPDEVTP